MNFFKKQKLTFLISTLLVVSMLFTACGSKKEVSTEKGEKELQKFSIVLDWYPNAIHSFIYDAIEKGYYAEEGLEIEILFPSNTSDALSLTAANKADLGIYYPHYVIEAIANNDIPVKSIGALVQEPLSLVLSLKDKNITSPTDLIGKTLGATDSPINQLFIKTMIEHEGGTVDDVNIINVGFELMNAMITENVDATLGCMINHEVPQLESQGFELNYFYPHEFGVPSCYDMVFVTGDKQIENEKEALQGFMRASIKGFNDMKADPDAALDLLLANQNAENFPLDKDVEKISMDILLNSMEKENAPFTSQTPEVWEKNIKWLYDNKIITKDLKAKDVMVNIFE